jgi:hypothetical protein
LMGMARWASLSARAPRAIIPGIVTSAGAAAAT